MDKTYTIYKHLGATPLEALERLRAQENIPADMPMTYAGRLDPAAEGKLIILVGDECKKKDEYTGLDKTYLAEILIGVSTDSYDLLGLPTDVSAKEISLKEIETYLESQLGMHVQTYPPYSSKTVDGKQLHAYTNEGAEVDLPTHEVTLHSYDDVSVEEISREDILVRVGDVASRVSGDFRQEKIVTAWAHLDMPEKLQLVLVELKVSSGFYVRQFAEDLGKALGTQACLYSLVRTEIGK